MKTVLYTFNGCTGRRANQKAKQKKSTEILYDVIKEKVIPRMHITKYYLKHLPYKHNYTEY